MRIWRRALAATVMAAALPGLAGAQGPGLRPDQVQFRGLYKELVEWLLVHRVEPLEAPSQRQARGATPNTAVGRTLLTLGLTTRLLDPNSGAEAVRFGVAQRRPGEPEDEWLQRVDEQLYAAKAAGRNTFRFFDIGLADSARARAVWTEGATWQGLRELVEKQLCAYDFGEAFASRQLVLRPRLLGAAVSGPVACAAAIKPSANCRAAGVSPSMPWLTSETLNCGSVSRRGKATTACATCGSSSTTVDISTNASVLRTSDSAM